MWHQHGNYPRRNTIDQCTVLYDREIEQWLHDIRTPARCAWTLTHTQKIEHRIQFIRRICNKWKVLGYHRFSERKKRCSASSRGKRNSLSTFACGLRSYFTFFNLKARTTPNNMGDEWGKVAHIWKRQHWLSRAVDTQFHALSAKVLLILAQI